jgi:predicted transcriptional regulator
LKLKDRDAMERLHKLLFELASAERLKIMLTLKNENLKLSQLSRELKLTVTETSRHLQRLNEAKLVDRNSQGIYELTRFGRVALFLIENLDFISAHREYFLDYDLAGVPDEFVARLGELREGIHVGEALRNLQEGERNIRNAQQFVWILSDDILANTIPILKHKLKAPFDLRIILPTGKFPAESESHLPLTLSGVQKRIIPKIDVLVVVTENFAVFCLPTVNGKIDYTGFTGKDEKFHKWCKDLFLYYWGRAKPVGNKQT